MMHVPCLQVGLNCSYSCQESGVRVAPVVRDRILLGIPYMYCQDLGVRVS